ncbi:hypothetical protein [Rhodococcus artemisiae]|uniref:Uncharacterized protein n=1 Tax=Rhodococcus artemisiae TaxID=714159 RepID=A0ABU7LDL9_9NOCA|nr:hypothetical protein [Rhodococcus artemisiae]MEE2059651.1 hypothetical protein [Rhodococcus artemisiae]
MTFAIVKVSPYRVGGLVVPGAAPGVLGRAADLMTFTLERLRDRGVRDVTVAYVRHPEAGWSAVAGYRCDNIDELVIGDSLVRVSEKYAARFVPDGASPNPCEDLWDQVEAADKRGEITRAFTEEILVLPEHGEADLYVSLG